MFVKVNKAKDQGDKDFEFDFLGKLINIFCKDNHTNELRLKDASGE